MTSLSFTGTTTLNGGEMVSIGILLNVGYYLISKQACVHVFIGYTVIEVQSWSLAATILHVSRVSLLQLAWFSG